MQVQTEQKKKYEYGFTLVELLVVMGMFAALTALSSINLINTQTRISINSIINTLNSDIKNQQMRTMSGDTANTGTPQNYGIYFTQDEYILFNGDTYNASSETNFEIPYGEGYKASDIGFPSSQLVFERPSGEVTGYTSGNNYITITYTQSGQQKTISVNRYGAIDVE